MSPLLAHRTKQRSDAPDLPPGYVVDKLPDNDDTRIVGKKDTGGSDTTSVC